MKEIIILGRGGQGGKSAAQIIALAASKKNYVQAFPEYGPERTGAPTKSFVRISDKPIKSCEPLTEADYIIIIDNSLTSEGLKLKKGGKIINNSEKDVPATKIAEKILGMNKPNIAMLGAFAKVSGMNKKDMIEAIKKIFGKKLSKELVDKNIKAFEEGYKAK